MHDVDGCSIVRFMIIVLTRKLWLGFEFHKNRVIIQQP